MTIDDSKLSLGLALMTTLLVLLLGGCTTGPRPYPAPVEHRHRPYAPPQPPPTVEVIPQPDYGTGFQPAPDDPYDAGDDYGFAPMEEQAPEEPPAEEAFTPSDADRQPPEPVVASPVQALTDKARQQTADGQYEAAAGSLERALRIEPNDPDLWVELAQVRLAQGELDEAGDLTVKSRSLAIGRPGLQARSWRLLAQVREQQGDIDGADQALETAAELDSLIR